MSGKRVTMRRIRDVLRYHFEHELSNEKIGLSLHVAKGSVHNILQRFRASGLPWPVPEDISDSGLEAVLYPSGKPAPSAPLPDIDCLVRELARPHVTLQLLWEEYRDTHPAGMSRSSFYRYYREHRPQPCDLKMIHKGGDKLFVDYSGDGPSYVDRETGEIVPVELFVCSWGASSYCYAEATRTQGREDFIGSHERALRYFGVAPHALVPDNLKSGVTRADRYDPEVNPLYAKFAAHYGTAVIPARVRKPQDKAVVESNVKHVQRYILARLRDRIFYSLVELNEAIRELLERYNRRPMKDYGNRSRHERFMELDRPHAKALPAEPFRITDLRTNVRVGPNYHIRYADHFYSVPHHLVRKQVDVYRTGLVLEIYHDGVHCCRHRVGYRKYGYTTVTGHMPPNHRYVRGWSADWFLGQAELIGPSCRTVIERMMKRTEHVQQGFNAALGVLRLGRVYTPERLESACRRADRYRSYSLKALKSILDKNLDQQQELPLPADQSPVEHLNLRGAGYYRTETEKDNTCIQNR